MRGRVHVACADPCADGCADDRTDASTDANAYACTDASADACTDACVNACALARTGKGADGHMQECLRGRQPRHRCSRTPGRMHGACTGAGADACTARRKRLRMHRHVGADAYAEARPGAAWEKHGRTQGACTAESVATL